MNKHEVPEVPTSPKRSRDLSGYRSQPLWGDLCRQHPSAATNDGAMGPKQQRREEQVMKLLEVVVVLGVAALWACNLTAALVMVAR